jgi:hypothetical protein
MRDRKRQSKSSTIKGAKAGTSKQHQGGEQQLDKKRRRKA